MNEDLSVAVNAVREKLRLAPGAARVSFESRSRLVAGFRSEVSIRGHRVVVDEPAQLGGGDAGPNPIELLLGALGACQEITYRAFATVLGIELRSVAVELEGEIDLRGFFGIDPGVRAGFERIRGRVHLDSPASPAELEQLKRLVDAHCPVLDMLSTPVPIELELAAPQAGA